MKMKYHIKPIYNYTISGFDEETNWCSNAENLIIAIHNDDNGREGEKEISNYDNGNTKILKKIGIYLDDNLIRICNSIEEADQTLIKLENLSKKIEEMKVTGFSYDAGPESIGIELE